MSLLRQQNGGSPNYSLITSLYSAWEEYKVPAIFYHYLLSVLARKEKKAQIVLMARQIKLLKGNRHHYHTISNAITARERSLEVIAGHVGELMAAESVSQLNWEQAEPQPEVESEGYQLIFESRVTQKKSSRSLVELINHLKIYQRVTYQVIVGVYEWQSQLYELGYQGPIQFIHQHQDYLLTILQDTQQITQDFCTLFENNPFLILKKAHQHSEYALVYQNVRFGGEFAQKVEKALEILSDHSAAIERHRILGNFKQVGSRKKIQKSESLHKIYCNYNRGRGYLVVKDPYLRSDHIKADPRNLHNFLNNKNVLINPEVTPRVYPKVGDKPKSKRQPYQSSPFVEGLPVSRSVSLKDVRGRHLGRRESTDPTLAHSDEKLERLMGKKLSQEDSLEKTLKRGPADGRKAVLAVSKVQTGVVSEPVKMDVREVEPEISRIPSEIVQQEPISSEVVFRYETAVDPYEILRYLRERVFAGRDMSLKEVEIISKRILSEKDYITLVGVEVGGHLAAWLAIKFLPKDLTIRKAVDIIFIYKFFKIPSFEEKLIEEFMKKGYGIIRQRGKIAHELSVNERLTHQLVKVKYKVSTSLDRAEVKQMVRKDECLRESRLLKYHYYSRDSKYHRYCDHVDTACQIGFHFEEVFRLSIGGKSYFRARCDRITKHRKVYRVEHHVNETDLLIAGELEDLLDFQHRDEIEFNSSFESEPEHAYDFLCLPEAKVMHKHVSLTDRPLLMEYVSVGGEVPEVLSLAVERKAVKNYLVVDRPFFAGVVCKSKEDFGKSLAVFRVD